MAEIRALIRAGRAGTSRAPGDGHDWPGAYLLVVAGLVAAALASGPVRMLGDRLSGGVAAADPARLAAGVLLALCAVAAVVRIAMAIGPVVLSAADAAWLLCSPLGRRAVLGRTAIGLATASAAIGAGVGIVALGLPGAGDNPPLRLALTAVLGAAVMVTAVGVATLAQATDQMAGWVRGGSTAVLVLAAAATVLVLFWPAVPGRGGWAALARAPAGHLVTVTVAVATVAIGMAAVIWRRLATFPAVPVIRAAHRLGAGLASAVGLEPGFLARIAEDDHWRGRRLRSHRWPTLPAPLAMAWADWLMLVRRPGRLGALLASVLVPALLSVALGPLVPGAAVPAVFALALAAAASGTVATRRDADDPALGRLLGGRGGWVLAARAVLPALLATLWTVLAVHLMARAGLLPAASWWALAAGASPAFAVAAIRMARRGPIDHFSVPVSTGMGWVPAGWLVWLLSGIDLALPGAAVFLWALAIRPHELGVAVPVQVGLGLLVASGYLHRAGRRP